MLCHLTRYWLVNSVSDRDDSLHSHLLFVLQATLNNASPRTDRFASSGFSNCHSVGGGMSVDIGSYPTSGYPDASPAFDADDAAAFVGEPSPMDTFGCCDSLQGVMSSLFADSQPGGASDTSYTIQGTYMLQRDNKADFGGFGREPPSRPLSGNLALDKFCAAADLSAHFAQAQYAHFDDSSPTCLKPPTSVAPPSAPFADNHQEYLQHHKQQTPFPPHQSGFHQHPGLPSYHHDQKDVVISSSSGNCSSSSSSNSTICYQGNQTVFSADGRPGYQHAAYQTDFYADSSRMPHSVAAAHNLNFPSPDHHHGGAYRGDINIHIAGQHYASPALPLNLGNHIAANAG